MTALNQLAKIHLDGHEHSLKEELFEKVKQGLNYHQKTLRKGAQPDDFFKEISHEINLGDLYRIKEIRLMDEGNDHCPVMIEIVSQVIKEQLGSKLQLWGSSEKYFFYQPGQGDPLYDEMHIIDNQNIKSVVKVNNLFEEGRPTYQFCSFDDKNHLLIVANEDKIKFISVPQDNFKGEEVTLEANNLKMRIVDPKLNLKGIFTKYFAFEREDDHQLDFNYMEVENFDDDDTFSYVFKQDTEIIPRNTYGFCYAVALRKSGKFDLYWNNERKYSSDEQPFTTLDVEMSLTTFFFKNQENGKEVLYKLDHEESRILNWDMAEKITNEDFSLDQIVNQNAKNFAKLYIDMMIVSEDQTLMIVAHKQFLSCYDMISGKWVKHIVFLGGTIKYFFQIQYHEEEKYVYVILEDGELYRFDNDEIENHDSDIVEIDIESQNKAKEKIPGTLLQLALDNQQKKIALIFSKEGDDHFVRLIYRKQDTDITASFKDNKISDKSNFVIYQGLKEGEMMFFHQNEKDIARFVITIDDGKKKTDGEEVKEETKEGEGKKEEGEEAQEEGDGEEKEEDGEKTKGEGKKHTEEGNEEEGEEKEAEDSPQKDIKFKVELQKQIIKNYLPLFKKKLKNNDLVISKIHSVINYKDGDNIYLIFFDEKDMFIFSYKDKELYLKENQYVRSFIHFENSVNYALCKDEESDASIVENNGLFYYNLDDVIKNLYSETVRTLPFKLIDLGCNHNLCYSSDEQRIGYFNELSHITVVPLLHTNLIKFIGINKATEYYAYKVIKDRFMALHKSGKIESWNLITGKFISANKIHSDWFEHYELHNPQSDEDDPETYFNKKDKVLLKSKEAVTDHKLDDFYQPYQLVTSLDNQKSFISTQEDRKLAHWRYIEILNEFEIVEHCSFYHPTYEYQYLYISNNLKDPLLIERLLYSKVYLYKADFSGKDASIKWSFIRRLENYDRDLESNGAILFVPFYSPDFTYHIDLDRKNSQFQIRETISNKIIKVIPKDLLTFNVKAKELAIYAINRIQWLDDRRIRILSTEGVEKIVDFQDKFKELSFNVIPNLPNYEELKKDDLDQYPFYYERSPLGWNQTEEWLLRKWQDYESEYYLFEKHDAVSLNEILYSVERTHMQYANLSFTFLHWSLIQQIGDGKINIGDINEGQIQAMLYNILPNGESCLHKLCRNDQPDDVQELFKISCPNAQEPSNISYIIPIIPNFKSKTALHVAKKQLDYKTINIMLQYLKGYGIDHHSKAIKDIIPHLIDKGLPEMPAYLGSRLQQTAQIKKILKAKLKKDFQEISPLQLWYNKEDYSSQYIDDKTIERRIKCEFIDMPEVYHYTDKSFGDFFEALAGTDNFDYFKVKTVQKLIEFNYPLVTKFTIRRLFYPYIVFQIVYVLYHTLFYESFMHMNDWQNIFHEEPAWNVSAENYESLSSTYDLSEQITEQIHGLLTVANHSIPLNQLNITEDGQTFPLVEVMNEHYNASYQINMFFGFILCSFAAYFLINEMRQFWDNKLEYLTQIWNYIDIIPPIGIFIQVALFFLNIQGIESFERQILALTTFFMWIKLLYFMRIFKNTGYLIRMIVTVIFDMKHFLLVLFIALIAFGDTFLAISNGNAEDGQFTSGFINSIIYTYCLILGGFDPADYDNSIAYAFVMILFLLCTIFNMIVMLNLLIAIISESFANVNSNAKNAMYQEMAALISENNYLIPDSYKESYAKKGEYLMVITDLEAVDNDISDPVQRRADKRS